jgi:hypothetical protein
MVSRMSFLFGTQQPTVVCRATVDLVSMVTYPRSILYSYEKLCAMSSHKFLLFVLLNILINSRISQRSLWCNAASSFKAHQHFWWTYCLHLQGFSSNQILSSFWFLDQLTTLKMAILSSGSSIDFYQTTRCHISDHITVTFVYLLFGWFVDFLTASITQNSDFHCFSKNMYEMNCFWPNLMLWPQKWELKFSNKNYFFFRKCEGTHPSVRNREEFRGHNS